jgi:hypothetical protein
VSAKDLDPFGELMIVGDDHSAIAETAEVFAGEEAQTAGIAKGTGSSTAISGPDRLGTIFDYS